MARSSLSGLVENQLAEHTEHGERFVDMGIDVVREKTGRSLLSGGGRWDRVEKRFTGDRPARGRLLRVHEGQLDAVRWWASWYRAHRRGERLRTESGKAIWSYGTVGGRRSGKSDWAIKAGVFYAVDVPGSIVWVVIPDYPEAPEIVTALKAALPDGWYEHFEADYHFALANGSVIDLKSSHDPEDLRKGRCDVAIINEAQKQAAKTYVILRPATADRGGLTMIAANPPDEGARGWWVDDWVHKARAGKIGAKVFELDPAKNPHVEYESLDDLRHEIDARTFARDIMGQFLPNESRVFYAFSAENVRPVPAPELNRTEAFLNAKFGRPFRNLFGMDFQLAPHQVAIGFDFFEDECALCQNVHPWITSETLVEGTEHLLVDALEMKGFEGATSALIPDASGEWQNAERTKGRGSWDMLRGRGWVNLFFPDERVKVNPPVEERVQAANFRFQTADGRCHIFVSPTCTATIEAFQRWEKKHGRPDKRSKFAHIGDGGTYPVWRFWPRKAPPGRPEHTRVERAESERERAMKGF